MAKDGKDLTLEEAYDQLEQLLTAMETEEHTLAETFQMYTRGVKLLACCNDKIDKIEKELIVLEEEGVTNQ